MTNVLRGKKNSAGQRLEENTRFNQTRNRLQPETTDRFNLLTHLVQLRNAIGVEVEALETLQIFGTRVLAVRRAECFPDRSPNTVLALGVGSHRYWRAGPVSRGNLCDGVAACAIVRIAKSGMVRIELHKWVDVIE